MFQSYISSQQQGHHTALPDNSQLFLKQFLYLRNKRSAGRSGLRDPSWKMSSLSSLHSLTGDARGVSATLSTAGTSVIPIPAKAQPDPARCFHTRSLNHSPKRRLEMALWGTIFSILTQLLPEIRFVKRIFFFSFKRCKLVGNRRLSLCLPFPHSLPRLGHSVLSAHYLSD